MSLTVTKEKVLEAANQCDEAKKVLKTLFPEVFTKEIDLSELSQYGTYIEIFNSESLKKLGLPPGLMQIRSSGTYANKGFCLNNTHIDWKLVEDEDHYLVLVPTWK